MRSSKLNSKSKKLIEQITPLEQFIKIVENGDFLVSENLKKELDLYKTYLDPKNKEIIYDVKKAMHSVIWIEEFCRLYEGDQAKTKIKLSIWQKALINAMFGFHFYEEKEIRDEFGKVVKIDKVKKRLIQEVFLLIASGNGKTTLSAAIGNYIINGMKLNAPKMFIAANSGAQAELCWTYLKEMAIQDPRISRYITYAEKPRAILRNSENKGYVRALSNDLKNNEGINPVAVVFDEVHEYRNSKIVTDLKKNVVKQSNQAVPPIFIEITTAGYIRESYYDDRVLELKNMLNDPNNRDKRTLVWLFEQDNINELNEDFENVQKSNPQVGLSITKNSLKKLFDKVKNNPAHQSQVYTKHFNVPAFGNDLFFTRNELDYPNFENEKEEFTKISEYDNKKYLGNEIDKLNDDTYYKVLTEGNIKTPLVFVGFDGALGSRDLSVITLLKVGENNTYKVKQYAFLLEKAIDEASARDKIDYIKYVDSGDLILIDAETITENHIIEFLEKLRLENGFVIQKMGIDRYNAKEIIEFYCRLEKDLAKGIDNNYNKAQLTRDIVQLKELFENKKIQCNSKLLKLCMSNAELKTLSDGNLRVEKIHQNARIDAVWSLIYSFRAYMLWKLESGVI